jgi:transglutaminase-like putative cysteine protease
MGLAVALGLGGRTIQGGSIVSSEGRARVGLSILLVLTLLSFAQVFAAGDYPGPALLGMVVASGLAIGARRLGLWTSTTVAVNLIVLFLYLVVIFQARNSFFLLPSPDAVVGLGRSIGNALRHSSVDYAPVPVRSGYVVLIVVGMWVATMVAEVATFRWRRPLLAALPCIGLFAIQMTVGTGIGAPFLVIAFLLALLTFWGLESAHRVRSWGRWVATFPATSPARPREGREPESVTGALARRMGAGCVAAAVVAPFIVPALGDGLLAWRNQVGNGGFGSGGGSGEVNPLVSIAPRLLERSDDVLFRVESERSAYWRLLSLAEFDGVEWTPVDATAQTTVTDGLGFAGQSNSPGNTEPLAQTFTFDALTTQRLPAAINPFELDLPGGASVIYDLDNQDLLVSEEVGDDFSYTVTSNVPELSFAELEDAEVGLTDDVYETVPEVAPRVRDLANQIRLDPGTGEELQPGEFLIALQDYLRTFTYDDSEDYVQQAGAGGASVDYLYQFLFELRRGYCQQFATAFALLARLEGIPTRVAVGFLPGERNLEDDSFDVTGAHTHAWPEVYLEDYGWVRFDPTPRLQSPEPRYTRPPLTPGLGGPADLPGGEGVGAALGRQDFRDRRLAGEAVGAAPLGGERALGTGTGPDRIAENPVWARAFNRLALTVAVLLALFLASVPALKRWRIDRRYRRARGADAGAAAAFKHFEDEAAELAVPRGLAESAAAFAARLATLRKVPSDDAARLAQIYEAAEYGPRGVGPAQAGQAKVLARKLRGAMWARASWWTRAARLFSPKGLVGRS